MSLLQAIELSKQYNDVYALRNLNLSINKGEIYCLLGQNGAGKTTTINLMLGFVKPSAGKILFNNIDLVENPSLINKHFAYIPEVVHLYGSLTGLENLEFFSKIAGNHYTKNELVNFLNEAGLQESAHHKLMTSYSKGMRQKVAIAIAIAKKADCIFMDEPTSGLDPKATNDFITICKKLAKNGTTIFMATHDIFNAVNVANTIGIMREGILVNSIDSKSITASALEKLYLETI